MREKHRTNTEKRDQCNVCDKTFLSQRYLEKHIKKCTQWKKYPLNVNFAATLTNTNLDF